MDDWTSGSSGDPAAVAAVAEVDPLDLFTAGLARPSWHADAACRGSDPTVFFFAAGHSADPARAICATCPVTADCLAEALQRDESGVWGSTTGAERRAMRRTRREAA